MEYGLYASLAFNALGALGMLWVGSKLAATRADNNELEQANLGLRRAVVAMQADAELGRKVRAGSKAANEAKARKAKAA